MHNGVAIKEVSNPEIKKNEKKPEIKRIMNKTGERS